MVSREVRRHGGRAGYRVVAAQRVAAEHRCRPKTRKIDADPELAGRVVGKLRAGCSPERVAGRLRYEHPGQQACHGSHEAIYSWIYALPKGELARHGILLRSGRTRRASRGRACPPGVPIVGMRSIDQHPAEVAGRQVPSHWEGDLVIGKAGKTAMATLVERVSRYTVPVALPAGRRDAQTTCNALISSVAEMPSQLVKTLTFRPGQRVGRPRRVQPGQQRAGVVRPPHSPWERGTGENTNRLLREYFPKATDITDDQTYLNLVATELNNRPRRILGYRTPAEAFADLLTSSIASTG